ncbi:hypothetical protein [Spirosoma horti]
MHYLLIGNCIFRPKSPVSWCCLFGVFSLIGCNQPAMQVLGSSTRLTSAVGNNWVKGVRTKPGSQLISIVGIYGQYWKLPADSVWGYRTKKGETYRLWEADRYEVRQQGALIVYRLQAWGTTAGDYHYFSLTPTSPIYAINKRICRQVFSQNECMVELLNQLTNGQLTDTDSHGSFGLVNSYLFCLSMKKGY